MEMYKGEMKTIVSTTTNGKPHVNEMHWDADYDGEKANISVDIHDNHLKSPKHYEVQLNNDDLAEMLSVPSVNMPLEKRLKRDFMKKTRTTRRKRIIEIDTESSLLFPEKKKKIRTSYYPRRKTQRRFTKKRTF